jgi:hypothetical protein
VPGLLEHVQPAAWSDRDERAIAEIQFTSARLRLDHRIYDSRRAGAYVLLSDREPDADVQDDASQHAQPHFALRPG